MNSIVIIGMALMLLGLSIQIGMFKRIFNITSPGHFRIIGMVIVGIGFLIALSQSTPKG
jgi:hypothetical protein